MSSNHLWVKICANTTLHDAMMAAELGADAVGFVFAPSKRQVTIAQVAAITPHLPPSVEPIGVFAGASTADLEQIALAVEQAGLTAVQLHGASPVAFVQQLQVRLGPAISIIQTAHWTLGHDADSEAHVTSRLAELAAITSSSRILIDAKIGPSSGGLGVSFDWNSAQPVFASQPAVRKIVAGGLRPQNVAQAVAGLKPYGVDVASGVEEYPGKKDPAKVKAFIQAARGVL